MAHIIVHIAVKKTPDPDQCAKTSVITLTMVCHTVRYSIKKKNFYC